MISHNGRIKVPVALMDGVNEDTVWTWNAIGKRSGAWNLAENAGEVKDGFLLNHLISEMLPQHGEGAGHTNSDPVTGQAAWFDLRVRIEKATPEEAGEMAPTFEPMARPPNMDRPERVFSYGATFRKARESEEEGE